jgi:hypothetical protein
MLTNLFNFVKNLFVKPAPKPELIKFEVVFLEPGILADDRQKKLIIYRVKREVGLLVRFLRMHMLISEKAMQESFESPKADVESNSVSIMIPPRLKIKLLKELSQNYSVKILP